MTEQQQGPDDQPRAEEREEGRGTIDPGPLPTPEEDAAADKAAAALQNEGITEEAVAGHYEEMIERGAHQKGEGRLP